MNAFNPLLDFLFVFATVGQGILEAPDGSCGSSASAIGTAASAIDEGIDGASNASSGSATAEDDGK